jgi:photosystem II stability/assembly factor-like uncharacterized protein
MGYKPAIALLSAVVLAVSGCANSTGNGAPTANESPGAGAIGAGASGATDGSATQGGPVPKGFVAHDLTFVSANEGWLLGTAPCSTKPCTSIVHTTDGGKTWAGIPAPKAELEVNGQNSCAGSGPCVRGLRFANSTVGYAYGSTALYLTTDGGKTWKQQPGQALGVELANNTVVRVSTVSEGCPPGCTFKLSTAPLGSATFTDAKVTGAAPLLGNNVQLLREGHAAYAEIFQNVAGGAEDAHATLLTSTDDGRTWTVRADPCGSSGGQEADSTQMAVADDGSLSVLCRTRSGAAAFVRTSTDHGASFGSPHAAPAGATAFGLGAASAKTLLLVQLGDGQDTLVRTADGGATWSKVATAAAPTSGDLGMAAIGFQSGTTGRWAPGGGRVLSTRDTGKTWESVTISG